jgi:replicative DNA helicase
MAERVLPHSLDAEKSVLGAPLAGDSSLFDVAAGIVNERHFFREAHQDIWKAMQTLRDKQVAIDMVTVVEELQRHDKLESAGGAAYVASLTDNLARSTNVEHYAQIVRGKATLRGLIFATNRIQADAYAAEQEPDEVLDRAEKSVMEVGKASVKGDFVLADDWMRETHEQIEKADTHKRVLTGVTSGIEKLDLWTRGFQPSDLIYLGARPSAGKTSMALQLALAASAHVMTGFVSMEMSRRVVGMRAVAMEAGVDAFRLMTGHLSEYEMRKVGAALNDIATRRLAIDDASGVTATQLKAKIRRLASRYGLGIVFIDYMQLLSDGDRAENRNQELSKISAGLKALARELDIPVIVLSQLSRGPAKAGATPQAHDLRDSGALEQDADVVMLLHRPQQNQDAGKFEDGEEAQLIIAKQRNGPTGTIRLQWIGEQMRFGQLAAEPVAPKQGALIA